MTTANFQSALFSERTGEAFLILLTIQHVDLASPIRVSSDRVNTTSRGNEYIAYPFKIILPGQHEKQQPTAQITIGNVHRDILNAIRQLREDLTITIEGVLSSTPDVVEAVFPAFEVVNIEWDAFVVRADLTRPQSWRAAYPRRRYTPSFVPGVFAS